MGDGRECSHSNLTHLIRQARWLERGIDLEGQGLVGKVQGMWIGADAGVGVLRGVVIFKGRFDVVILWHDFGVELLIRVGLLVP